MDYVAGSVFFLKCHYDIVIHMCLANILSLFRHKVLPESVCNVISFASQQSPDRRTVD